MALVRLFCSVVHTGYCWFLLPWLGFWMYGRSIGEVTHVSTRYGVGPCKLGGISLLAAVLAFVCAYAWYLSLTRTTVAANNSIYQVCSLIPVACACLEPCSLGTLLVPLFLCPQSAAAIVYVFSVIWLREKVRHCVF